MSFQVYFQSWASLDKLDKEAFGPRSSALWGKRKHQRKRGLGVSKRVLEDDERFCRKDTWKSENGNGMLKQREITAQPCLWHFCPPKRPQQEHNDIYLPPGPLFTPTAVLLYNRQTWLLALALFCWDCHFNLIIQALFGGFTAHMQMQSNLLI